MRQSFGGVERKRERQTRQRQRLARTQASYTRSYTQQSEKRRQHGRRSDGDDARGPPRRGVGESRERKDVLTEGWGVARVRARRRAARCPFACEPKGATLPLSLSCPPSVRPLPSSSHPCATPRSTPTDLLAPQTLLSLQLTSLIMFSTMASASKHNDSARQYVVAIGVIMWLLTSAIAVCYLLSYQHELPLIHLDHQGPVLQITGKLTLELVYYAVFGFLSLVAFFCAASHANGSGAAAASAVSAPRPWSPTCPSHPAKLTSSLSLSLSLGLVLLRCPHDRNDRLVLHHLQGALRGNVLFWANPQSRAARQRQSACAGSDN